MVPTTDCVLPVGPAVDQLGRRLHHGGEVADRRALPDQLLAVLGRERGPAAGAETDAAAHGRAGQDEKIVGAHAGDRFLDGRFRAFADFGHGDHGPHADDHAQGRQRRAHLVPPQGPQGGPPGGRDQRRQAGRLGTRLGIAIQRLGRDRSTAGCRTAAGSAGSRRPSAATAPRRSPAAAVASGPRPRQAAHRAGAVRAADALPHARRHCRCRCRRAAPSIGIAGVRMFHVGSHGRGGVRRLRSGRRRCGSCGGRRRPPWDRA